MKIGVIFGSRTVEHDVSITSAYGIMKGLRKTGIYEVFPIYISQSGKWIYNPDFEDINNFKNLENLQDTVLEIDFSKKGKLYFSQKGKAIFSKKQNYEIDVVIPILHGTYGEDGTVEGLLDLLQVPYASPSVIACSTAMNKTIMKNIFEINGLPITKYLSFSENKSDIEEIEKKLNYPLFVKPANLGSSIGVSKVDNKEELKNAIELAYYYDNEVIIEEAVENLIELNCSVMEKDSEIISSLVEQPVTSKEFLSFEEKYTSSEGGTMQGLKNKVKIPAEIPKQLTTDIQEMTKKVYKLLKCNGGAPRIDFLYDSKNGELYINEINSIPGALQLHLWVKSGLEVGDFLKALIDTAIEKNHKKSKLKTDFKSNIIDYTIGFQK